MMNSIKLKERILQLSDLVLLNTYSYDSLSLYYGKCGSAICLFEVSLLLDDSSIKQKAFEILCQSLLAKNQDISFRKGLSGIGYILEYVVKQGYIDADIQEIFGEQNQKIKEKIKSCLNSSERLNMDFYYVCVYLECSSFPEMRELSKKMLQIAERDLIERAKMIKSNSCIDKTFLLDLNTYLHICKCCAIGTMSNDLFTCVNSHMKAFIGMLERLNSTYIQEYVQKEENNAYPTVLRLNEDFEYENTYSLREVVNLLCFLMKKEQIELVEEKIDIIINCKNDFFESWLNKRTPVCGRFNYGYGLSRLVLLFCYFYSVKNKIGNVKRFDFLFL